MGGVRDGVTYSLVDLNGWGTDKATLYGDNVYAYVDSPFNYFGPIEESFNAPAPISIKVD